MAKVVEIFEKDGTVSEYRPLSVRWEQFLATYPPSEGYGVEITPCDPLSLKPGLLELAKEAIHAGRDLNEITSSPAFNGIIFRATLKNKEGKVLGTASSFRFRLAEQKDWEKAETSARQRLAAAMGFGGDVFDEDESADMQDQGLNFQVKQTARPNSSAPSAPSPAAKQEKQEKKAETVPEAVEEEPVKTEAAKPEPPKEEAKAKQDEPGDAVPASLLRQIEHQAKMKGKQVPEVKNLAEARETLKKLMAA